MKRLTKRADFRTRKQNRSDSFYDIDYDAVLIEESIAKQYHILPSQQQNLSYCDWAKLVSGLMNDTPLGKIVELRCEDDADIIKKMTPEQLNIRREWEEFKLQYTPIDEEKLRAQANDLERMIAMNFG